MSAMERLREDLAADLDGEDGFEAVYERYFPRLLRYCRRIALRSSAEDLAQETMVRFLLHAGRLDTSRPIWPWMKTIAANLAVDDARRRQRESSLEGAEHPAAVDETEGVEWRALLASALGALTPRQRAAVGLRLVEGREPREAAGSMGLTVAAFNQLLFRARVRLRSELRRLGDGALGGAAIPARWIHERWRRAIARWHRDGGWLSDPGIAAHREALGQSVATLLAMLIVLSPIPPRGPGAAAAAPNGPVESPRTGRVPAGSPRIAPEASAATTAPEDGSSTYRGGGDDPGNEGGPVPKRPLDELPPQPPPAPGEQPVELSGGSPGSCIPTHCLNGTPGGQGSGGGSGRELSELHEDASGAGSNGLPGIEIP